MTDKSFEDWADEIHPDKEASIEACFYRMDAGDCLSLCQFQFPCVYHESYCEIMGEDCPHCKEIEKRPGDTLADFIARCAQSN